MTTTEATVHANGIEIFYQLGGEGPPLLFCNGSGATLESAAIVTASIGEGFTLLAHDQRGLGKTEIPPGPYSMADYAADALALLDAVGWDTCRLVGMSFGGMVALELAVTAPERFERVALLCTSAGGEGGASYPLALLDAVGWDTCRLVGMSFGGMVALELAVTAPERFERIALLCTSPGGEGGASYPLHELDGLSDEERLATYLSILDTRFDDAWLDAHPGDQMIVDVMRKGQTIEKSAERVRGEREQLEARRHHDVHDRLSNITAPTFLAAGRYDGIAPLSNSEAILAGVPNAELHVYEGGHLFPFQDRTALPEIRAFLLG